MRRISRKSQHIIQSLGPTHLVSSGHGHVIGNNYNMPGAYTMTQENRRHLETSNHHSGMSACVFCILNMCVSCVYVCVECVFFMFCMCVLYVVNVHVMYVCVECMY